MRLLTSLVLALGLLALPTSIATADEFSLGSADCQLIEVPNAAPFGSGTCPGVRPGALVETPSGFCTMNFGFRGRKGARYIGTAGHCILSEDTGGERVWRGKQRGPIAKDSEGNPIGRFAYGVLELEGEKDFALIKLFKNAKLNPSVCHFGGPTTINRSTTSQTTTLNLFGNGLLLGEIVPARTFIANGLPNRDHVSAVGAALPGDSGGPVTDARGAAVGVLVSAGVFLGGSDSGVIGITRLGPQIDRAREQLRLKRLQLLTAPTR